MTKWPGSFKKDKFRFGQMATSWVCNSYALHMNKWWERKSSQKVFFFLQQRRRKRLQYRRPSLFADFLSANSLIHIGKIGRKCLFSILFLVFEVQNEGTYLPHITRETFTFFSNVLFVCLFAFLIIFSFSRLSHRKGKIWKSFETSFFFLEQFYNTSKITILRTSKTIKV